ncbi:hypothetical protein IVA95_18685 [Bradyrhizobium sp. 157]|uniref:hypothetical protein n=1 Tax=Bradyrhizobium sp. 157 TaxID=2782631 RepID=UPI001FF96D40|nr:hypothetical protein [Bradyrhizobium sp. 157]MCK1639586.1 hypothetical protein [Bradyrhizobium sp. 157]
MDDVAVRGGSVCVGPQLLDENGGVLIATMAPAEAILAAPNDHSQWLDEHEYVVDRRELLEIEVLDRFFHS